MKTHALATAALVLLSTAFAQAEENALTAEEKQAGWQLLFDGTSTRGWISIEGEPLSESHVQEGSLNPHPCHYMLVYGKPQSDFVLALDFKISPGCNSGVFVRTSSLEPRPDRDVGYNGIEIAIDDTPTAGWHDTGAIYDLVRPRRNAMRPARQWNHLQVTCADNRIEVEVNGEPVSEMDLNQWTRPNLRPDGSAHKFDVVYKDHPRRGYLGLQDHGSNCWYRNIKLRPLPAPGESPVR